MKSRVILLAEDNRGDALLFQRAFRALNLTDGLQMVEHGEAAIDYLAGRGDFGDRDRYPIPAICLLDLKMPRCSGFEVMEWLGQRPELRLPVVILTTSDNPVEIARAYALGAKSYLIKPVDVKKLAVILDENNSMFICQTNPCQESY